MTINPDPSTILKRGDEIILIGTPKSEERFMKLYGAKTLRAEPIAPTGATVGAESQRVVEASSTKP